MTAPHDAFSKNSSTCMICSCAGVPYLRKDGYAYSRCPSCGLIFLPEALAPQSLAAFYGRGYFERQNNKAGACRCGYDDYAQSSGFKAPFYRLLENRIRQFPVRTVLDVGAAYGDFVAYLQAAGYESQGIELSSFAAAKARQRGNNVEEATLESFTKRAIRRPFDLACLLDVFEHLYDYDSAMQGLRNIVKDGGFLLIVTPNSNGLSARLLGRKWYQLSPPQHTCIFHAGNIGDFLQRYGFRVLRTEHIRKTFSVKYFLHILSGWLRVRLPTRFLGRWGNVVFTFPLKDNILVIAKKL